MSKRFVTTDEVKRVIGGREVFEPGSYRKQWTASRLVKLEDGTTIPLLHLLVTHKFGAWDPKTQMPYWKDKLCTNEDLNNVELLEISPEHRPRQNSFGVPSGTKEYMKRWRAANRETINARHREYYRRLRALAKQAEAPQSAGQGTSTDNSLSKLLSILPSDEIPPELDRRKEDRRSDSPVSNVVEKPSEL